MASNLRTDYKDDILASTNSRRKYNMITNDDGTVSFEDVTDYEQVGDSFGAGDINSANKEINSRVKLNDEIVGGQYAAEPWLVLRDEWNSIPSGFIAGRTGYGFSAYIGNKMNDLSGSFLVFSISAEKMIYYVEFKNSVWQYTNLASGETVQF